MVARTTMAELMSMFEFMNEVETSTARLAAQRIDGVAKARLLETVRRGEESAAAGDVLAYSRVNLEFHALIYDASGNPTLIDAIRRVSARAAPFRRQALGLRGWIKRSAKEHAAIGTAIAAHDVSRAGELMARHMNIFARRDFSSLVALLSEQIIDGLPAGIVADRQPVCVDHHETRHQSSLAGRP